MDTACPVLLWHRKALQRYLEAKGGKWHAVTVDIDELADAAGDIKKTEIAAHAEGCIAATLAQDGAWRRSGIGRAPVRNCDRAGRPRPAAPVVRLDQSDTLRTKLLQHFVAIYRHSIPEWRIFVNGVPAEAVVTFRSS